MFNNADYKVKPKVTTSNFLKDTIRKLLFFIPFEKPSEEFTYTSLASIGFDYFSYEEQKKCWIQSIDRAYLEVFESLFQEMYATYVDILKKTIHATETDVAFRKLASFQE